MAKGSTTSSVEKSGITIKDAVLAKVLYELKNLCTPNGLQGFINILHYDVRLKLPQELEAHLDDPQHYENQQELFSLVYQFLPQLVEYYFKEAMARDCLKWLTVLKIMPDNPLFEKIDKLVIQLYSQTNDSQKADLIKSLKIITLGERLKLRYLMDCPNETKEKYDRLVSSLIHGEKQGEELVHAIKAELASDGIILLDNDQGLWQSCHSFPIVQSLSDPAKLFKRMVGNVMDLINSDFSREMMLLDDTQKTFLSPNLRLFRGLGGVKDDDKAIQSVLNKTHRSKKNTDTAEFFTYKINTPWVARANRGWIEGSGVFASLNPERAFTWGLGSSHITIEFMLKAGIVAFGKEAEHELIIDQVEPDEIIAVYKGNCTPSKGTMFFTQIYENPNFYGIDNGYKIASYPLGKNDLICKQMKENYALTKKRIAIHHTKYKDHTDFINRYRPENIREQRQIFYKQRGFKTYQERLKNYSMIADRALADIYSELKNSQFLSISDLSKYRESVDEQGNGLIALAVIDRNKKLFDKLQENGFSLFDSNFNQQNLLHLAAKHGFNEIIDYLMIQGVDAEAEDIEGFKPLHECYNVGNLAAIAFFTARGLGLSPVTDFNKLEEHLVFNRLVKFSKQHVIDLCYENKACDINLTGMAKGRLELLCSRKAVDAYHKDCVSIPELLQADEKQLNAFFDALPWKEVSNRYFWNKEYLKIELDLLPLDISLLAFPLAERIHLVSEDARETFKRTGKNISYFKGMDAEQIALLISKKAQYVYFLGIKIEDFSDFSKDEIQVLLSEDAYRAYKQGLTPQDYRGIDKEKRPLLMCTSVIESIASVSNKAEILLKLSQGDVEKNIHYHLFGIYYPNRINQLPHITREKLKRLVSFNLKILAIDIGGSLDKLVDFDIAKIRLVTETNFFCFLKGSGLELDSFEYIPSALMKKFCSSETIPTKNYSLIALLGQNQLRALEASLHLYECDDLLFIQEWARLTNQLQILALVHYPIELMKKGPVVHCKGANERHRIVSELREAKSSAEITSIFEKANYSHINGLYNDDRGFLAELVFRDAPLSLIVAMLKAGADPHYKRNGRDAFMELSEDLSWIQNMFSFFSKPITRKNILEKALAIFISEADVSVVQSSGLKPDYR